MSALILALGLLGVFAGTLLALAALTVLADESRGVSRSLAVLEAFSTAPKEMREEVEPSFGDRVLVPLVDRSLRVGRRLTPADYTQRLRRKLEVAGNPPGWTADRVVSLKFLGFVAFLGVALLVTLAISLDLLTALGVCILTAVVGYLAPNMYLYQLAYNRTAMIERALPDALDLLTISVESGLGFDAALSHVARNTEGPLADEFARVLQEMQIGMGRAAALRDFADRTDVADVKGFISSMVQADGLGIPISHVLRVQAKEIRARRRQQAEEKAQKVAIKILVPLVFCILPCLFIAVLGPAAISMIEAFSGGM